MTIPFPLRFKSKEQKEYLEALACDAGRSANSHILFLIDRAILNDAQKKERMALLYKSKKLKP